MNNQLATTHASTPAATGGHSMTAQNFAQNPALALWFDDKLFERAKLMATYMSKAEGFTPRHLIGKSEACFLVVEKSLVWGLSPSAVAASTYQTPNGQVGFEGKLVQAILQASGRLSEPVKFTHFGDWSKVQGKFEIAKSQNGKPYARTTYSPADEQGLGVVVSAKLKGESQPIEFEFLLRQAFPRNSTLWATDPMTQLCYAAVRRFASTRLPDLIMGVPFDGEGDWTGPVVDITPTPEAVTAAQIAHHDDAAEDEDGNDEPTEPRFTFINRNGGVVASNLEADAFVAMVTEEISYCGNDGEIGGLLGANDFDALPRGQKAAITRAANARRDALAPAEDQEPVAEGGDDGSEDPAEEQKPHDDGPPPYEEGDPGLGGDTASHDYQADPDAPGDNNLYVAPVKDQNGVDSRRTYGALVTRWRDVATDDLSHNDFMDINLETIESMSQRYQGMLKRDTDTIARNNGWIE